MRRWFKMFALLFAKYFEFAQDVMLAKKMLGADVQGKMSEKFRRPLNDFAGFDEAAIAERARREEQAQIEAEQITFCAKKKLELPGLVIDNTRHEISANGRNISLTRLESDLLWVLAVCEGTTLSKKELFDAVWGKDCADTLKVVGNTVSNLRKKLAFCGLDGCLCTVGGGYAFRYVLAEQGKAHSNTVPTMVYCCPKELRENDPNLVHLSGEYLP